METGTQEIEHVSCEVGLSCIESTPYNYVASFLIPRTYSASIFNCFQSAQTKLYMHVVEKPAWVQGYQLTNVPKA